MKKLLIFSNVLTLLLVMLLVGCSNDDESGESVLADANRIPDAQNCYAPAAQGADFEGLNAMLVYYLAKNYKNQQLAAINSGLFAGAGANPPTAGDARSVWFDLETIKRFIYEIESQTCGKCDNSSKVLGIRIYYGAYPDSSAWRDTAWRGALESVPMAYAGKHTVMMVPTYHDDETNAEMDFDPNHVTQGCDFTNIETFYSNMKTNPPSSITLTVLAGMNGTAQNHGELVPPPFSGASILDKGAGIMYAADNY